MEDFATEADLSRQSQASQLETYEQEIFSLRRNEAALKKVQQELSCELESIHKDHTAELKALTSKYENMIKLNSENLSAISSKYEIQLVSLTGEIKSLQEQLSQALSSNEFSEKQSSNEATELESMYQEKIDTLNEEHESKLKYMKMICGEIEQAKSQLTDECADLRQELECVKQNYNAKKEEVEQLKEQLQELQEELTSLQMHMNTKPPDEHEQKGNSLFAEVNDRRLKLESILRQDRATFLEMKRRHSESTKQNRIIGEKILSIENCVKNLMQKIGSEDVQLQKSYESSLDDQRICIRSLEKKIDKMRKEQTQTAPGSPNCLHRALDCTRNDLQSAQTRIEDLCLEKRKLYEMIRNSEKEAQRWQAESASHAIDILKLKLQITELQVEKNHESFERNNGLSAPQQETISKRTSANIGKVTYNSIPIIKNAESPISPCEYLKKKFDSLTGSGDIANNLLEHQEIVIKEEQSIDGLMKIVEDSDKENMLGDLSGFSPSKPKFLFHAEADICKSPKTEIENKNLDHPRNNSLTSKLSSEDNTEINNRNECTTSILKAKDPFLLQENNENVPATKGVTFSSDTASPQNNAKLKKKVGVAVPVTFVKRSDRCRVIVVKEET